MVLPRIQRLAPDGFYLNKRINRPMEYPFDLFGTSLLGASRNLVKDSKQRTAGPSVAEGRYSYRPLDPRWEEIRLLDVAPGIGDEPLQCSLRHAFLRRFLPGWWRHPRYETVSYCWQTLSGRTTICIDGILVSVTASSAAALKRLRLPNVSRRLWIDAICIDQDNVGERSQQVSIMGVIYHETRRALVWLGESEDSPASVKAALEAVLTEMRSYTDGREASQSTNDLLMLRVQNPKEETWTHDQVKATYQFPPACGKAAPKMGSSQSDWHLTR